MGFFIASFKVTTAAKNKCSEKEAINNKGTNAMNIQVRGLMMLKTEAIDQSALKFVP